METDLGVRLRGKRRSAREVQSINCDLHDLHTFQRIKKQSSELKKQERENKEKLPTFAEMHQDIYNALFKYVPQQRDAKDMRPGYETNHDIIRKMLGESMYKELRSFTTLDEFNAAIATKAIADHISHLLPEVRHMPKKSKKKGEKDKDDPSKRKQDPKAIQKALQQGMGSAKSDCDELEQATQAWGNAPGSPHKLPYKEKVALAQRIRNSRILRQLAKIAGRMRSLALSTQRTKISKGSEEIYSVEIGDDVQRMLPQQLSHLTHPILRLELFGKIINKEVLQFSLRDRKKATRGPIVCAIDNSGSMSGDREVWAKAVALGLLEICVLQKRKFVGIHFGWKTEIRSFEFDWENYTMYNVLDFAEFFFGGGTDFEKPLEVAADYIGELPKADIVMITDGECCVEDRWLNDYLSWRDESEVTIFGVLVDTYGHYGRGDNSTMNKFCNGGVILAKDIMNSNDNAASVFGFV